MPASSLAISTTGGKLTGIVIENEIFSPPSSTRPFSPVSQDAYSSDEEDESSSDSTSTIISPNLRFSFEGWDAPFHKTVCQVEVDDSDGSQVLSIPSTSPFFHTPATPVFKRDFTIASTPDCSLPSICPTLSSRFDLLLSSAGSVDVVVVDSEPVLDDVFPRSIHVVKEIVEKDIPDFPQMVA